MKTRILMLAVLAASLTALAQKPQPPSVPPLKVELVKQQKAQAPTPIFVPLAVMRPAPRQKIERVDGMSSQPWIQIVGLHPGWAAIPRPERHEPTWRLLQIKF